MEEFISLWITIQQVHLMSGTPDTIIWRWTASGAYSTRSAYRIQFSGFYRAFRGDLIWKAHTKNKCKVFAWIMAREKALTADNLQKKGWPHQKHCTLCNGPLEASKDLMILQKVNGSFLPCCYFFHSKDKLAKVWVWEMLLPYKCNPDWSDYCNYLGEYYKLHHSVIAQVPLIYLTFGFLLLMNTPKNLICCMTSC